ncbi:MAG: ABC transporter ATP-binding protein/permease [Planctomycetes bacterium]|nr:ABC transporter ATP-binding protein/permease [Planctomycetota bacterium]
MPTPSRAGSWRWFAALVRPWRGRLAFSALSLCISSGVALLVPGVAGLATDAVLVQKSLGNLRFYMAGLFGLFAVASVLDFFESWILQSVAAQLLRDLRDRLHAHLLTLTPAFYDTQRTGDLLSRLNADTATLGSVLTRDLVNGLQSTITVVGALTLLVLIHVRLAGVMLLIIPPLAATAVLFARRIEKVSEKETESQAEANVAAEEALSGIRTVQAFAREPEERKRYSTKLMQLFNIEMKSAVLWGIFHACIRFFGFSAIGLVVWYGVTLQLRGQLSPGKLTSFMFYTMAVGSSVVSLTALYGRLVSAIGATARLREILATKPALEDAPDAKPLGRALGEVAFEDVRFTYATAERPALDGVSLHAAPGDLVALVGPSGAGKTTLASLLLRFHDPQSGRVLVDAQDTRTLRLADLRGTIGFVPQDVFLLGGTVSENIRFGRPTATDTEVRAAAESAQASGFIDRLPKTYETIVGERGIRLSTGERQRIAIARVFLKDPSIVLLDEATSALDAESESLVQKAFERLFMGRTTLVIAHRLATVRRASKVVVLEHGKVVEEGRHEELLAKGGLYRRLCELQMLA